MNKIYLFTLGMLCVFFNPNQAMENNNTNFSPIMNLILNRNLTDEQKEDIILNMPKDILNQKEDGGCTPLHIAAAIVNAQPENHHKVFNSLLKAGADCSLTDDIGNNPLHFLVEKKIAPKIRNTYTQLINNFLRTSYKQSHTKCLEQKNNENKNPYEYCKDEELKHFLTQSHIQDLIKFEQNDQLLIID
ncbi:MAG: ankyrin repeat domain-containing protein [Candidatus Babeliales bacterium]